METNIRSFLLYQNSVGSICQDDYKGPNRQYVVQDKLIIVAEKMGGT